VHAAGFRVGATRRWATCEVDMGGWKLIDRLCPLTEKGWVYFLHFNIYLTGIPSLPTNPSFVAMHGCLKSGDQGVPQAALTAGNLASPAGRTESSGAAASHERQASLAVSSTLSSHQVFTTTPLRSVLRSTPRMLCSPSPSSASAGQGMTQGYPSGTRHHKSCYGRPCYRRQVHAHSTTRLAHEHADGGITKLELLSKELAPRSNLNGREKAWPMPRKPRSRQAHHRYASRQKARSERRTSSEVSPVPQASRRRLWPPAPGGNGGHPGGGSGGGPFERGGDGAQYGDDNHATPRWPSAVGV